GWLGPGLGLRNRVGAAAIADVGAAGGARRGVARVGAAAARAVEGGAAAHVAGGVPLGGVAAHVEDAGGAHALGERAGRGDLVAARVALHRHVLGAVGEAGAVRAAAGVLPLAGRAQAGVAPGAGGPGLLEGDADRRRAARPGRLVAVDAERGVGVAEQVALD